MNSDHSTPEMSDQVVSEPAALAERTALTKSAWHRPSLTHIDVKRTLSGAGTASDGGSPTA